MKSSIIQLGGLGNQMFIYAYYYAMKKRGYEVQIDASLYNLIKMHNGYELPAVFDIKPAEVERKGLYLQWLRLLLHFKPHVLISEELFDRSMEKCVPNTPYITGYWQSDIYFKEFRNDIKSLYRFKTIFTPNLSLSVKMQCEDSVSLHIRRGDYLDIPGALNICSREYYIKAIEIIQQKVNNPHFYIFSNDTVRSREFAEELGINYAVVDHNIGVNSYQDMYLMTQCKHNILANSSFSWWGAYLNVHDNAIRIAPKIWYQGHSEKTLETDTPVDWIRI